MLIDISSMNKAFIIIFLLSLRQSKLGDYGLCVVLCSGSWSETFQSDG